MVRHHLDDNLLIDSGGLGYEVHVTPSVLSTYGLIGSKIELFIHTDVREDAILLFGFPNIEDRKLFQLLLSVNGIGAKTAMTILSSLPLPQLIEAIQNRDVALLQSCHGVGKKTAQRMVTELSDRIRDHFNLRKQNISQITKNGISTSKDELVSALLNLGYKRPEAEIALSQVDFSKFSTFDRILKETLKVMAR